METGKKMNNKEGTSISENTITGARFFIHDEINQVLFNVEGDDGEAQFNMGLFYAKGHGVKRDFAKMSEWMSKASENGDEDAEGFLKEFGNMADDLKKAENGDAGAQAEVAARFMKLGPIMDQAGSEGDYEESVKWAAKSAEQNNGYGLWTLALAYEHGRGVASNPKKAVELYQKGADINDSR